MTRREHLIGRAKQLLDHPTLSAAQRVPDATALLNRLTTRIRANPALFAVVLAEVDDPSIRAELEAALKARL